MDPTALAKQLRKPEGDIGKEVGRTMAEMNEQANALTLACLDIQPEDHVLEIGFGPGEALAEAVSMTRDGFVAGIDHSQEMVDMASARNQRSIIQDRLELTVGDASSLPYEDESFDKVFSINVLHFWEDPALPLAEMRRVLRPGGTAAIFLYKPESWMPGFKESGVFHEYSPLDLEKRLIAAGFRDANVHAKLTGNGEGYCVVAMS